MLCQRVIRKEEFSLHVEEHRNRKRQPSVAQLQQSQSIRGSSHTDSQIIYEPQRDVRYEPYKGSF